MATLIAPNNPWMQGTAGWHQFNADYAKQQQLLQIQAAEAEKKAAAAKAEAEKAKAELEKAKAAAELAEYNKEQAEKKKQEELKKQIQLNPLPNPQTTANRQAANDSFLQRNKKKLLIGVAVLVVVITIMAIISQQTKKTK